MGFAPPEPPEVIGARESTLGLVVLMVMVFLKRRKLIWKREFCTWYVKLRMIVKSNPIIWPILEWKETHENVLGISNCGITVLTIWLWIYK